MSDFVGVQFAALRGYWNSVRRRTGNIPSTEDFSPAALREMAANLALLHVLQNPQRFRFDLAGANVASIYGAELEGRFADEVSPDGPLACFAAQCATTVKRAAPTLYSHPHAAGSAGYQRLMLPLWADGRANAILAVFDFAGSGRQRAETHWQRFC